MARPDSVRVNFYMPVGVVKRVDEYAKKNDYNRTTAITVIINEFFKQEDSVKTIAGMTALMMANMQDKQQEEK